MKKRVLLFFSILFVSNHFIYSQNIYKLIANNDYEKVKEYTKPLNIYNRGYTTPLMWAIYKSDLKMVKLLVSKGANPEMRSWMKADSYLSGSNFVMAAWTGKIDILDYLLKEKFFKIDEPEYAYYNKDVRDGWNALHTAAFKNNIEVINYLVKKGADINSRTETNENKTPLLLAIHYENYDAAKELIRLGADVNIRDVFYNSSLELALNKRNKELVKLIYKKGFKFTENRKDEFELELKKHFNIDSFEQL